MTSPTLFRLPGDPGLMTNTATLCVRRKRRYPRNGVQGFSFLNLDAPLPAKIDAGAGTIPAARCVTEHSGITWAARSRMLTLQGTEGSQRSLAMTASVSH